MLEIYRRDLDK